MASSAGTQGPSPFPPGPGRPRSIVHLDMVGVGVVAVWVGVQIRGRCTRLAGCVSLPAGILLPPHTCQTVHASVSRVALRCRTASLPLSQRLCTQSLRANQW